jgi:hypothetical protein
MKKSDAIKRAGSAANLARILRIHRNAITQWGENLPDARVWQLKAIRPEWFTEPKQPKPKEKT